jgi:hypothetical protein
LSANEIDKILTYVKYALVKKIETKDLDTVKEKITAKYDEKIVELNEVYEEEKKEAKTKKQQTEVEKMYKENKDDLDKEFNRLKSIVADIDF